MRTLVFLLVGGALVAGASIATATDAQADVYLGFGYSSGYHGCGPAYYPSSPVYIRPAYVPTYSHYPTHYYPTYSYPTYSYPTYSYPTHSYYYPSSRKSYYRPVYRSYPRYRSYYRPYVSTGIYFGGHYGHRYHSHRYHSHRHHGHRHGSRRTIGRRR